MRSIVVLPTYNEAESIGRYFDALRAATSDAGLDVDVLVVDDNSPDGTAQLVKERATTDTGIHLLERPDKAGLGGAYRAGFARALDGGYDVIVSMDADLSHDPRVIADMLARIEAGADVVVGSRYIDGGGTADWPVHRRVLSRWGNAYTRTVLRLGVRDCTSGFRAYSAAALAEIEPETTEADGYAFLTELIRRADRSGARIEETPIVFVDRAYGKSKMSGRIIVESMLRVTGWAFTRR